MSLRIQDKKRKKPKKEDLNVLVLPSSLSPHHSACFFLSVWMAAARGAKYLEEARLRQQRRTKSADGGKDSAVEADRN